jgi:CRISPR-associated endonuclease Cas3-HD
MDKVYSHPPSDSSEGTTLIEHSYNVAEKAQEFGVKNKELIRDIALLHDIGKSTEYFQDYILNGNKNNGKYKHSKIGSIAALFALRFKEGDVYSEEEKTLAMYAIHRHHTNYDKNLDSINAELHLETPDAASITEKCEKQIEAMDERVVNKIFEEVGTKYTYQDFKQAFKKKKRFYKAVGNYDTTPKSYTDGISYWSSLTFADKICAASIDNTHYSYIPLCESKVKQDISQEFSDSPETKINRLKTNSRIETVKNSDKLLNSKNTVGTITLPTGFGKTMAGLASASHLATQKGGNIIYALPYTSIIDQTDTKIQNIFGLDPKSSEYTIHHHLAETTTTKSGEEKRNNEMVAKSWRSSVVLTTFVQLFESLTGPKNSQGLKLSSLKDSTIIIDEPQALPHSWRTYIPYIISEMMKDYNISVISMTATHPAMFEDSPYTSTTELTPTTQDCIKYLSNNPRVEYKLHKSMKRYIEKNVKASPLSYSKAANHLSEDPNSSLVICNTIDSARKMYNELENQNEKIFDLNEEIETIYKEKNDIMNKSVEDVYENMDINNTVVCHLSSRHRMKDRKIILDLLTETSLLENHTVKLVSTQLVEAGVDISFEKIYRDVAPIPSIIQAGGRCNRNNSQQKGEVTIWRLDTTNKQDDRDKKPTLPSEAIYSQGNKYLKYTREVLESYSDIIQEHKMISACVDSYYEKIPKASDNMVQWAEQFNVKRLSESSLIPSKKSVEIVLPVMEKEWKLTEKLNHPNPKEVYKTYEKLDNITVSVPVYTEEQEEKLIQSTKKVPEIDNVRYPLDKSYREKLYTISLGQNLSELDVTNQFV